MYMLINSYYFNNFIMNLLMILMILLSLAFLTLLEQKLLGYIQIRKGPNKVAYMGILQPFADAIKLFTKEMFLIKNLNYMFYIMSPILSIMLMLMMWLIIPNYFNLYYLNLNLLLLLCFLSMGVYMMMISGWSSNSTYSMLGSIRSIAQTISYEVSMILIMLSNLLLIESLNLINLINYQFYLSFISYLYPLMLMFLISIVAELNRTPFDLAEGESELVSGFNTEYMSGGFAMIFMAEYGMIMLMSLLFVMFYLGNFNMKFMFYIKTMFMMNIIIIFRGSFPRYRYDKLMMLIWKSFLPIILNIMIYMYMIKWMINLKYF
uniref:NADH dehydrogenase subunit 1 n=1 Tax=Dryocosmus liui TaxID=2315263 RepID=UPI002264E9FB|nr:NADH dehydrogenase subunit 1 [Dryocosmus liui]UEE83312.1 NADH dehydrogenase subunit 1 [Dryocosmus liui]